MMSAIFFGNFDTLPPVCIWEPLSLPTFFLAFPKCSCHSVMYLLVDPVLVDGPDGGDVRVEELPERHLLAAGARADQPGLPHSVVPHQHAFHQLLDGVSRVHASFIRNTWSDRMWKSSYLMWLFVVHICLLTPFNLGHSDDGRAGADYRWPPRKRAWPAGGSGWSSEIGDIHIHQILQTELQPLT